MSSKLALVTGAGGCVGRALVRRLVAQGWTVNALDMNPVSLQDLSKTVSPGPVQLFPGTLTDSDVIREAARGVAAVFHTAAKVHSIPRSAQEEAEFQMVNVGGTENLLRHCTGSDLRSFVFFSTIAVYGSRAGNPLTESTAPQPENPYARSKLEAEQRALEFSFPGGARSTIFRMSLVYGEGERGNFSRMMRSINAGRFVYLGDGGTRKSMIYAEDVARAALLAAESPQAQGEIFVLSDARSYSVREISETLARHLGVRGPKIRVPIALLRAGGRMLRAAGSTLGFRPMFTDEDVTKLMTDTVCDISKIRARLGFEPQFAMPEGVRRTVEWYRQEQRRRKEG